MPGRWFLCPDGKKITIKKCLSKCGCRMAFRCALLPYLRAAGEDREWRGITPSRAGTGPRKIGLEQITDYAINPDSRAWAVIGVGTHGKLSIHKYTDDVLSEEAISDEHSRGIADVLTEDESREGWFELGDYKTWGSFKVAKAKGIVKVEVQVLDEETGKPATFKSGKRKGQPKTRKEVKIDPSKIDLLAEELQLNRYRIFFEKAGFPISKIWIQAIPRDGGTQIAFSRGVMTNVHMIPLRRLKDDQVLAYYDKLREEVNEVMGGAPGRKCNNWETWGGRRCSPAWCEVYFACPDMKKERKS